MASDIKTIQGSAKIDETVSQGGFTGAAAGIAAANSTQSNIGMQVADGATMRLMEYVGTDLGKNPRGNIPTIPGISYTDKLQAAYAAQSQVTLGLQAQDAFNAANLEMEKKIALSPEDIMQYQKTMSDVIKDTTELAPNGARENLQASLTAELSNKIYQNNIRMTEEQRKRDFAHDTVYLHNNTNSMIEANNMGNHKDALAIMESNIDALTKQFQANKISEVEYTNQVELQNKKYQSSKLTKELSDAAKNRGSGAVEKLLSEIPDKVPRGMRYAQWIDSAQEAYTNFRAIETFKSGEQNTIKSNAFAKVVQFGTDLSQPEYEEIKSQLPLADYQALRIKINSYLNPKNRGQDKVANLVLGKDNALAWQMATNQVQMGALVDMASSISNNATRRGSPISQSEALSQAAQMTPIAVKGYKDYLNNAIASGSPQVAMENAQIIHAMKEEGYLGQRYQVDKTTEVAAAKILRMANDGVPMAEAVAKARELVYTKDSEESKKLTATFNDWKVKTTQSNRNDSIKLARDQIGKNEFNKSVDHDALANEFYSLVNDYWQESKGDQQLSVKLATDFIHRNYGMSTVNGKEQYVIHPPEQVLGDGLNGSKYLIVDDARNSIEMQFKDLNDAYAAGKSDVRIEFPKPNVNGKPISFEGLRDIYNQFSSEKDIAKARNLQKDYQEYRQAYVKANERIEAIAKYRDGHEVPLTAVLNATQVIMQDGEKVGDWGVHFEDKNGIPQAVQALSPYYSQRIFYAGESQELKKNIRDLGITPFNLQEYQGRMNMPRGIFR